MEENALSKATVLAVEDDAGGMAIITAFLRRMGMQTYADTTGMHTLELLREINPLPDIVFMDLKLPGTSGFEILKQIRADTRLKNITVVAVTALDANTTVPLCQESGFDGYIAKPLRRKQFIDQVQRILRGEAVWDIL